MPDNTEIRIFGTETTEVINNSLVFDDTKLQTLDRRVGKDNLFFSKEMFQQSLNDWEQIPVIYQKDGIHPDDFEGVVRDPYKAAEAIGGKMVGRVTNPRIVIEGGARLMATLSIDGNEAEIERLWQIGKLFPSTAFSTHSDGDRITTPPIPNHVLIFPIQVDKVVPGDFGAYVNSQEIPQMTEEMTLAADTPIISENSEKMPFSQYLKTMISKLLKHHEDDVKPEETTTTEVTVKAEDGDVKAVVEEVPSVPVTAAPSVAAANTEEVAPETHEVGEEDCHTNTSSNLSAEAAPAEPEVTAEVPETNTVVEEEVKEENTALTNAINEVNSLKAELEQYKHAEREQKFEKLLHALPCGMTQTEEQKKAIREQYENDLEGLLFSVLENKAKEGTTEKAGVAFTHSEHSASPFTTVGDLSQKIKRD